MIKEFSIEPTTLKNVEDIEFLFAQFGVSESRLITDVSVKNWISQVMDNLDGALSENALTKAHESLLQLKEFKKLVRNPNRQLHNSKNWILNTIASHNEDGPFDCILTEKDLVASTGDDKFITKAKRNVTAPPWFVKKSQIIKRNESEIIGAAKKLLNLSHSVVVVDPHLCFDSNLSKHVVSGFVQQAAIGCKPRRMEFHSSKKFETSGNDYWINHLEDVYDIIKQFLKDDFSVDWIRWENLHEDSRDSMHPRYVLTDLGGIKYDYGVSKGKKGETTDLHGFDPHFEDMPYYDPNDIYASRWRQYCAASTEFEFVEGFRLSGSGYDMLKRSGSDGDSNREFVVSDA